MLGYPQHLYLIFISDLPVQKVCFRTPLVRTKVSYKKVRHSIIIMKAGTTKRKVSVVVCVLCSDKGGEHVLHRSRSHDHNSHDSKGILVVESLWGQDSTH